MTNKECPIMKERIYDLQDRLIEFDIGHSRPPCF